MPSRQPTIKPLKSGGSKANLQQLLNRIDRETRLTEACKVLMLAVIISSMLLLLSACGTTPVVTTCPKLSLPEQYKHDYPKLPSAQEIIGHPVEDGDDLSVLIKTAVGLYQECRISHNSLWRRCDEMLEAASGKVR